MALIGDSPQNIVPDLTNMSEYDDTESLMNAALILVALVSSVAKTSEHQTTANRVFHRRQATSK